MLPGPSWKPFCVRFLPGCFDERQWSTYIMRRIDEEAYFLIGFFLLFLKTMIRRVMLAMDMIITA